MKKRTYTEVVDIELPKEDPTKPAANERIQITRRATDEYEPFGGAVVVHNWA